VAGQAGREGFEGSVERQGAEAAGGLSRPHRHHQKQRSPAWCKLWSTEERLEFFGWIAGEPEAGAVIKDSGGCRKVRWSRPGTGKSSGFRVIYFTRLAAGELCMLLVYPKSARDTIPGHILRMIRKELEDGIEQEG